MPLEVPDAMEGNVAMLPNLPISKQWKHALAAVVVIAWCAGCSSTRTTLFNEPGCDHKTKHIKGVPTNVEVPTHVRITIHEVHYARYTKTSEQKDDNDKVIKPAQTTLDLVPSFPAKGETSRALTARHASYEFVRRKETFGVDLVRPAAGTLTGVYVFGDSTSPNYQKITRLDTAVEDKTIDVITDLVRNAIALRRATPQVSGGEKAVTLVPIKSDIACEFFDIHDPDLTNRIQAFLDKHLNQCHTPYPLPTR
jgi:hypothetical protein